MANDVALSASLRNNLLSLQNTQRLIDSVQLRLATGLKINSALDGPQQFFTSQSLNNRAADLGRLLDGINLSIRAIEEADKGITALTKLVEQGQSIAQEAQSELRAAEGFASITGTTDLSAVDDLVADSNGAIANGDDIRVTFYHPDVNSGTAITVDVNIATGDTIYDVVGTINSTTAINPYVKASVDANGRLKIESLRDGGLLRIGDQVGGGTSMGSDGYGFLGLDSVVGTESIIGAATGRQSGTLVAGRTLTSAVSGAATVNDKYQSSATLDAANYVATGDTVEFSLIIDGQSSGTISVEDDQTIQQLLDGINNNATIGDLVEATFNEDTGRIELAFADGVGQAELQLDASAAGDVFSFGFGTGAADGTMTAASDAESEIFNFIGSSANLVQYRDDYNTVRDQIDDLVNDANFRGVNLLGGDDLTTFFNEDRTSSLVTQGVDFSATGLGLLEVDFDNALDVQQAIDATDAALASVRNFGTAISNSLSIIQTRRDFTEGTINTLKAGASDLVKADENEEGANLLALQTRQQLGVTSLSLAAQSQQSVLRLF